MNEPDIDINLKRAPEENEDSEYEDQEDLPFSNKLAQGTKTKKHQYEKKTNSLCYGSCCKERAGFYESIR